MNHTLKGTVGTIAVGSVLLATTIVVPPAPPTALVTPRASTESVQLVVLPGLLVPASEPAAAASAVANIDPTQTLRNAFGRVVAGAGYGVILGFIAAAAVSNVIYQTGPVGLVLAPIIPVVAVTFAIVGAPIGAVVGALSLLPPLPIRIPTAGRKAAVTSSRDSARPGSRSNRNVAKPAPAPAVRKAAAKQQRSETAKAGSGRDRGAASNRSGQH